MVGVGSASLLQCDSMLFLHFLECGFVHVDFRRRRRRKKVGIAGNGGRDLLEA